MQQHSPPPLVVDLDDTLLEVDTLPESFVALACRRPAEALGAAWLLLTRGRAAMKARIAACGTLDVERLPLRDDFVAWLREQRAQGRSLHLASAANRGIVEMVAARLGIFASAVGSDGVRNLKGASKAAYLEDVFPGGFSYAGDSAADLAVWKRARAIVLVNASPSVRKRALALGKPVEAEFSRRPGKVRAVMKELRLHQWSKNGLVFLPLLLAHRFEDVQAWLQVSLAFLGLGLAASATYIINDIVDLDADRRHATKRDRPIASGALSVGLACLLTPLLLAAGFALTYAARPSASAVLLAYLVLTLSYSFRLKRVPLLDTAIIGLLFTLRILLGGATADLRPSPWLLAFSTMLFFSLAMAKRQTEMVQKGREAKSDQIAGRGYQPGDAVLSLVFGITTGVASLVVLMLYTTNGVAAGLYHHPNRLWGVPLLLYLWQMRIWLFAHRGTLHDDPIVFALKDRISLLLGACCVVAFYLAL